MLTRILPFSSLMALTEHARFAAMSHPGPPQNEFGNAGVLPVAQNDTVLYTRGDIYIQDSVWPSPDFASIAARNWHLNENGFL